MKYVLEHFPEPMGKWKKRQQDPLKETTKAFRLTSFSDNNFWHLPETFFEEICEDCYFLHPSNQTSFKYITIFDEISGQQENFQKLTNSFCNAKRNPLQFSQIHFYHFFSISIDENFI